MTIWARIRFVSLVLRIYVDVLCLKCAWKKSTYLKLLIVKLKEKATLTFGLRRVIANHTYEAEL